MRTLSVKKISLVIAAIDTYDEIKDLLCHVEQQTIRQHLEVLIICRTRERLNAPESALPDMQNLRFIEGGKNIMLNQARALGVRESEAPYVAILEDHCFPAPSWAEHMLLRLEEGWTGVGPVIALANPKTIQAQAAIMMAYGQWLPPISAGQRDYIPGHNSIFVRKVLLERGNRLEGDMVASSLMQAELRQQGHRFYVEDKAVMYHWECSKWRGLWEIYIPVGRASGALRARDWRAGQKVLYGFATPLIAGMRWSRALVAFSRTHKTYSFSFLAPLFACLISAIWSFGELLGFWFGFGNSLEGASDGERNRPRYLRSGEWPQPIMLFVPEESIQSEDNNVKKY